MNNGQPIRRRNWLLWVPLGVVIIMAAMFIWALRHGDDRRIQSHWMDKPLPAFDLPAAAADRPGLTSRSFGDGQPRIINLFASWCIPCRVEAPALAELQRRGVIVEGVAIRDRPEDLARFLGEFGNPYHAIGADERSQLALALGSSGVPETFLIDGRGMIREQIQGAITPDMVPEIMAKLERMR